YSVRQVIRVIGRLRDRGLLVVTDAREGSGEPTEYAINLAAGVSKKPFDRHGQKLSDTKRRRFLRTLLAKSGPVCTHCSKEGDMLNGPDGRAWHIDRIVPGSRGGKYTEDNVPLSCGPCNRRRKRRCQIGTPALISSDAKIAPVGDVKKAPAGMS